MIPVPGLRVLWRHVACTAVAQVARTSMYLDARDLWIGVYRDPEHHRFYVCLLPGLVIRYQSPRTPVNRGAT